MENPLFKNLMIYEESKKLSPLDLFTTFRNMKHFNIRSERVGMWTDA